MVQNDDAAFPVRACRFRNRMGTDGRYQCTHPQVHTHANLVTQRVCRLCDYVSLPERQPHTAADGVASARNGHGRSWTWAVGITTAPRKIATLAQCVNSMRQAGWTTTRIFAEPGAGLPAGCEHLEITGRDRKLGAFPNWYLGLTELVMRQPRADAYLMVQDDALFAVGLRSYLEQVLWPSTTVGVVSLYCPSHYSQGRPPGMHVTKHGWQSWGALAYVFPNLAAAHLLRHPAVLEHRRSGPNDGLRNVDSVVGAWCAETQLPYYVHVPSLVQHIGDTSTLFPDATASGKRAASDFVTDVRDLTPTSCFHSTFRKSQRS